MMMHATSRFEYAEESHWYGVNPPIVFSVFFLSVREGRGASCMKRYRLFDNLIRVGAVKIGQVG
jgi:hypothetical protein